MKLANYLILWIFGILLVSGLLSAATTQFNFHDTPEYISVAKEIAGYGKTKAFSSHSFLYSFLTAQFLKIYPSIFTIKFFNSLWLLFTSLLLWFNYKDKKVFLLFALSPIAWHTSIQFTPIMPTTFFLLLSYITLKRWENEKNFNYLVISALSMGMVLALYTPAFVLVGFFILVFFFDKELGNVFYFLLFMLPTFCIRIILDYLYTGIPFYSLIRYFGTNIALILGYNSGTPALEGIMSHSNLWPVYLFLIFGISPLLYKLKGCNFVKEKKESTYLLLSVAFFILKGGLAKYFLMFTPNLLIMLRNVLTKRDIVIHIILSIFISAIVIYPYFGETDDLNIKKDLEDVMEDFPSEVYIAGSQQAMIFAADYWNEDVNFIWRQEYESGEILVEYSLESEPSINLYKKLELKGILKKTSKEIEKAPAILRENEEPLEGYELRKCYRVLCYYEAEDEDTGIR